MEPFTKALEVVARVMREGAATHPDNRPLAKQILTI
jgi:hypothetical protein